MARSSLSLSLSGFPRRSWDLFIGSHLARAARMQFKDSSRRTRPLFATIHGSNASYKTWSPL